MKILSSVERFNPDVTIKKEWVPKIELSNMYILELYNEFSNTDAHNEKLLNMLQSFNTNICKVDLESQIYTVIKDQQKSTLSFSSMGKGERLFVALFIANELKKPIIISYEISQLAMKSIKLLFELFDNSPYITIVPPNKHYEYMLVSFQNEWRKSHA